MMERRGSSGAARACTAGLAAGLAVVVLTAAAGAKPAPGSYAGTTSEKGTVDFIVTSDGKDVVSFTTTDGYNGGCKFHGGAGGLENFTVKLALMTLTSAGTFSGTVKESNAPFKGTTTFRITGKISGPHASGTVDVPGRTCGSGASNPGAPMYRETFSAKRG